MGYEDVKAAKYRTVYVYPDVTEEKALFEAENRMADVAALFGKELGEEFMARLKVGFEINCKFTNEGFKQELVDGDWYDNDNFLRRLLTGEAEIVEAGG